jgi:hypothetical protein
VGAFWRAVEERLGDKKGQVSRVVLYGAAARG